MENLPGSIYARAPKLPGHTARSGNDFRCTGLPHNAKVSRGMFHPDSELSLLWLAVIGGLLGALICAFPSVIYRVIKKQPIIPTGKQEKLQSPQILYFGIALFGGMAVYSFTNGLKYFALVFFLLSCIYVIGLMAYRKGWRG